MGDSAWAPCRVLGILGSKCLGKGVLPGTFGFFEGAVARQKPSLFLRGVG